MLFTNTSTASGNGFYLQAANVLRGTSNGNDRFEINVNGVRTKGTHTFENTIYTNLTPTLPKVAVVNTDSSLSANFVVSTIYQNIGRTLLTLVSSTAETTLLQNNAGSTLISIAQQLVNTQFVVNVPFKLSTTGTCQFRIRYGEAATALASRTIVADSGAFSPSVTAQGGVIRGLFTIVTAGASGTAVVVGSLEIQINGKTPVISVPLRVTTGVSTLVDNLFEVTCQFGTSSASDRIDVENSLISKGA